MFDELTGTLLPRLARKVLQRHDELSAFGANAFKAVVPIERFGHVVLGINHQREDCDLGSGGADGCVCQQGATQLLPVERPIDSEAPDSGYRY